jgi:type I restriction enzyme S subunit
MNAKTLTDGYPNGWSDGAIGDVADYVRGVTYQKSDARREAEDGYIPLLRATNIGNETLTYDEFVFVPRRVVKPEQIIRINDMVMAASSGSISVVGKSAPVLVGFEATFGAFCAVLRPKNVISPNFFRLYIQSPICRETWSKLARGTNINNLKREQVLSTAIPIPPLDEQEKIAQILDEQLSRLDAAIASVHTARRKAVRFRRSLLSAAFSGSLSGHESVVGVLPLGWKLEPLGKCGQWFGGGTPSKSNQKFWDDGTIPWLSPKDMGEFRIRETQDKITTDAVEQSSTKLVPGPSVAMVMRSGILERTFPIAIVDSDITLNQDMKAVVPNSDVSVLWIAYALNAFELELLDTCRKSGTTVASMETVRLMNFEIPLPEISEQLKIIGILEEQVSRLDASLAIADAIEKKVNGLRRSLLHAAFTGELTKEWREGSHV